MIISDMPLPYTDLLIGALQARLADPLPGQAAQMAMASIQLPSPPPARPDHRKSGVLCLLYPANGDWHLVFMQRPEDGTVHGGQISFPGGRLEPEDPDLTWTALREAQEELGILPASVHLLGSLTELYIPASNHLVFPTVGYAAARPDFVPDPKEVAAVIEAPLAVLLDPDIRTRVSVRLASGLRLDAPAFVVGGHVIWGATAMILNELLSIITGITSREGS
ncbi:MAG: CoA pyrophosphatase [Bacteroidia bacterium]|nr:CoA pyrophosphatase [Bacteroidia bacterium]